MEHIIETKSCKRCNAEFNITKRDQSFYQKINVPFPTHCPDCREQRRLITGNQLFLYNSKCDLTGKPMITNYHPDSHFQVYHWKEWSTDAWDPMDYERDFDFNRPFFEQFAELRQAVPVPSLFGALEFNENSEYVNYAGKNKNCYMIFDADENQDCYFSYSINGSLDCIDCYRGRKNELSYECIDSGNCYNSYFLQDCENCSNSYFLKNCIGCSNCIGCVNLRNKEYHIFNKPVTPEEFKKYVEALKSRKYQKEFKVFFEKFRLQFPEKSIHGVQNENTTGDYVKNCKDSIMCFDGDNLWDCTYSYQSFNPLKDCMDTQECGDAEMLYECAFSGFDEYNLQFCSHSVINCSDMQYCMYCIRSSHLFGCTGLKGKKFCILNKQYTENEYFELRDKIIEHMKQIGEHGEFFPMSMSDFAYNETLAHDHYPMTKEQVINEGLTWREKDHKRFIPSTYNVPDTINEVDNSVLEKMLACISCERNYKIIEQELKLLRKLHMPIPEECFFCRNTRRKNMRNARTMFERACMKCRGEIHTTYSPDRPEIVYCEKCYLESVE